MIQYDEYGDPGQKTILLLHGAGALDTFCHQYEALGNYHLVVPHLHGAGASAGREYDPDQMQQELLELIGRMGQDKIGMIGHSLGAQIAVALVSAHPELFSFAVFLSAWVNPVQKTVKQYEKLAGLSAKLLHLQFLTRLQGKYWGYTAEQTAKLTAYAQAITPQVYRSFFIHTLELKNIIPSYYAVTVPMLAVCGSKEVRDMKTSLEMMAKNRHCITMQLADVNHDFPMRNADKLNPILKNFICQNF